MSYIHRFVISFFFTTPATTEIYTLSLHDALPICSVDLQIFCPQNKQTMRQMLGLPKDALLIGTAGGLMRDRGIDVLYEGFLKLDRKSTRLNSSHVRISYAVFCLKKKRK